MRSKVLVVSLLMVFLVGAPQIVGAAEPSGEVAAPDAPSTWYFPVSAVEAVLGWPYYEFSMVYVPGGYFDMGCDQFDPDDDCIYPDEMPLHRPWISSFSIDRYEVTVGQYLGCMAAGGCSPPHSYTFGGQSIPYYTEPAYQDYPAVNVDWYQAGAYCAWAGKRLPTEAEWEKAARGSTDRRRYPWGPQDATCQHGNFMMGPPDWFDCVQFVTKVGSYHPTGNSPYGVRDMFGNVGEWVADWYHPEYYSWSPSYNPTGPSTGEKKVVRGGCWDCFQWFGRVSYRSKAFPTYGGPSLGFRCVDD
jgi:formylglycine-generating enzyme required for sulfatase activity